MAAVMEGVSTGVFLEGAVHLISISYFQHAEKELTSSTRQPCSHRRDYAYYSKNKWTDVPPPTL